jgi:hypothetical protein
VKLCRLDDPQRDACIKESIQNLLPELRGEPKFYMSLDPYVYNTFNGQLQNMIFDGKYSVKNLTTVGLTDALVKNVKSEFTDFGMKLELDLFFPKLMSSGSYKTNLLLAGIKIVSKGTFNATLWNLNNKWTLKGKLVNINGEKFMKFYDTEIDCNIEDLKATVSGVFDDPTLSKFEVEEFFENSDKIPFPTDAFLNSFINRYWKSLYKELISESKTQWTPMVLEVVNNFFSAYPYKKLQLL